MIAITAVPSACGGCLRSQRSRRSDRPTRRCVQVRASAHQHLTARADDNKTTAYKKRLEETQRRKEMLAQARTSALTKGGQVKAIESGEMQDPEVVAANQEVEAANAKRQQESERSLQALQQKSADVYSKQSTKGPGLKGISYTLAASDTPSAFDFSDPPSPLSTPKDDTPSPPVNPSSVMNNSSSSPIPSALAPSQPKQQNGQDTVNPFQGLFESINTESGSSKSSQVPFQELESGDSRPTATEPPPRETFKATEPPAKAAPKASEAPQKAALKATEPPAKPSQPTGKTAKAVVQEPAKQVAKKDGKRRGPLPLFLGQFLVLVAYGGAGFLAFQKDEETRKAVAIVIGLFQKGYSKVQGLLPSGSKG